MKPKLSKMQNGAINFALDREGSAWFMPPGMGKTLSWLTVIDETPGRTLVVAPKLVCRNTWPRERIKWGFQDRFDMRFLHGRDKHLDKLPDVCTINYEAVPWLVEQLKGSRKPFPFDSIIFDELSKMKNPESVRFQALDSILHRFKYRNGGTGTPVGAHLKDLFGEIYCCDLGDSLGTEYERFLGYYFYHEQNSRTYEPYDGVEDEIFDAIRDVAISFDINDLDMPPLSHHPIYLDMPKAVREYYERMQAESVVEELDIYAANAAVRSNKLRQFASGGVIDDFKERKYLHDIKAQWLCDLADEFGGEPIMIFFEFMSDYVSICKALGKQVPVLYGKTKVRDADRWIQQWNDGKLPYLALHPRSASHGLNLQDSGRVLVWYTLPWSFELLDQGIKRLWRQGQQNKVLSYYLIMEKTKDEEVYNRLGEREATHNRVMKALL